MNYCFVIFGAGVHRDGTPSTALARRIQAALVASRRSSSPMFLVTGGPTRYGFTEADVMRNTLLQASIAPGQIVCEGKSRNTISSVLNCTPILQGRNEIATVFTCTDRFHQVRCRLLFRIAGIATQPVSAVATGVSKPRWRQTVLREIVAVPVDCLLMLWKRFSSFFQAGRRGVA